MPTVISVGRPFPGLRPQPVPGVRGLLDDRHATLHPVAAHPPRENTPEDVAAFETGRVRLGLARWSERTCFLLFAVEGFCRWSDAPMQLAANHPGHRSNGGAVRWPSAIRDELVAALHDVEHHEPILEELFEKPRS
jgi:hypothetical protein